MTTPLSPKGMERLGLLVLGKDSPPPLLPDYADPFELLNRRFTLDPEGSAREVEILRRSCEGEIMRTIAADFGLSVWQARHIREKALARLCHPARRLRIWAPRDDDGGYDVAWLENHPPLRLLTLRGFGSLRM